MVELGDLDPSVSPDETARLLRRQLLGEHAPEDGPDAADRFAAKLVAEVEAARADGLTAEEIRAVWQRVEGKLGD